MDTPKKSILAENAVVDGIYLTKQNQEVQIISFDRVQRLITYKVISSGLVGKKMAYSYPLVAVSEPQPVGAPQAEELADTPVLEPESVSAPAAVPPAPTAPAHSTKVPVAAKAPTIKKKSGPKPREAKALTPRETEILSQIDALKAELKSIRTSTNKITGVPIIDKDPVFAKRVTEGVSIQEFMDKLGTKVGWTSLRRATTAAAAGSGSATMMDNIIVIKA